MVVQFDVLNRNVNLNQHILCEASAGTGKTFTIEHLFIRRLLTAPKRPVKEIAVLTFTNAVALELTLRLKRALDKAISDLKTKNSNAADYLLAVDDVEEAIYSLETARDEIQYAAIDTIHGFCYRCLSEYDKNAHFATAAELVLLVEDFFRSALFDPAELKALLKEYKSDFPKLIDDFVATLWDEKSEIKKRCREFVSRELEKKGLYCMQELLVRMESKMGDSAFTHYLKKRFSCVIVDEFQDTDPRQWNIMQALFTSNWHGVLYLVGDPKQAIYSFRQADVYCYMQAKSIDNQAIVSLTTNFRSSSDLVEGLNTLFSNSPLFALPKLGIHLDVPHIESANRSSNLRTEGVGAIHFFQASLARGRKKKWPTEELETDYFYPYILKEITALGLPHEQFAILVKDRHQAARVEQYLEERGVPTHSWKKRSVVESEACRFLERLVACIANVRDRRALVNLVLHEPFCYSSARCMQLQEDLYFWAEHVEHLLKLKGDRFHLARLVQGFLQNSWPGLAVTLKELLWHNKEFLSDLEYLVELASNHADSPDMLLDYLHGLEREKEQLSCRYDPNVKAVQILTLHASKGLEFEVVFALGLANRPPQVDGDSAEFDAEKLRQFYVGATRAKRRLYLPVAYELDARPIAAGMASAMELFLQHKSVQSLVGGPITACTLQPDQSVPSYQKEASTTFPLLVEPLELAAKKYQLQSFSSQSRHVAKTMQEHALPTGIEVGILLHELLANKELDLFGTPLEGFDEEVSLMLKQARAVQLDGFSLADVDPALMRFEVPFYTTDDGKKYVRGSVDLLFEHNEKLYLVDWKSNALESYCKEALQAEVELQNYGLQAKLYTDALLKYTSKEFGGFYFVFLRGLPEGVLRYG
ncbi:MAG: UvrD-helicase domain-containing protein [Verrucomicrobia bacterium]|nr:UvrD-helicase domain-containing protein [Verrucomicrobiota bacterium]